MPSMRAGNDHIMQNDRIVDRATLKEIITCTVGFDGLTCFESVVVVDFGSSPTTSTAAWTLAMLQPLFVVLIQQLIRVR